MEWKYGVEGVKKKSKKHNEEPQEQDIRLREVEGTTSNKVENSKIPNQRNEIKNE